MESVLIISIESNGGSRAQGERGLIGNVKSLNFLECARARDFTGGAPSLNADSEKIKNILSIFLHAIFFQLNLTFDRDAFIQSHFFNIAPAMLKIPCES